MDKAIPSLLILIYSCHIDSKCVFSLQTIEIRTFKCLPFKKLSPKNKETEFCCKFTDRIRLNYNFY